MNVRRNLELWERMKEKREVKGEKRDPGTRLAHITSAAGRTDGRLVGFPSFARSQRSISNQTFALTHSHEAELYTTRQYYRERDYDRIQYAHTEGGVQNAPCCIYSIPIFTQQYIVLKSDSTGTTTQVYSLALEHAVRACLQMHNVRTYVCMLSRLCVTLGGRMTKSENETINPVLI